MSLNKVKYVRTAESAKVPTRMTKGSAGYDVWACLPYGVKAVTIEPGENQLIGLGFKTDFDEHYCALILARSGLAHKMSLSPSNCVGLVEGDYRGEWMVSLHNGGKEAVTIKNSERIAQIIFVKREEPVWEEVEELKPTERDIGGFGHTGTK